MISAARCSLSGVRRAALAHTDEAAPISSIKPLTPAPDGEPLNRPPSRPQSAEVKPVSAPEARRFRPRGQRRPAPGVDRFPAAQRRARGRTASVSTSEHNRRGRRVGDSDGRFRPPARPLHCLDAGSGSPVNSPEAILAGILPAPESIWWPDHPYPLVPAPRALPGPPPGPEGTPRSSPFPPFLLDSGLAPAFQVPAPSSSSGRPTFGFPP